MRRETKKKKEEKYDNKKRKVIRLRPKCAAGPAPSVIPARFVPVNHTI